MFPITPRPDIAGIMHSGSRTHLYLDNMRPGSAENLMQKLLALQLQNIRVQCETGAVSFDSPHDPTALEEIVSTLKDSGYPLRVPDSASEKNSRA